MIACPVCGFRNTDRNVRCLKCQALLRDDDDELRNAWREARGRTESAPRIWLEGLWGRMTLHNPLRSLWEVPQGLRYRHPWLAGGLALLPGLGQVYNHQFGKALLLAALGWGMAAVALLTLREPWSNLFLLALLLTLIAVWSDAVTTAIRANGGYWSFRNSVAMWFGGLFLAGVIATALQFLLPSLLGAVLIVMLGVVGASHESSPAGLRRVRGLLVAGGAILLVLALLAWRSDTQRVYTLVRVTKPVSQPVIARGDLVFVNNIAYWFRGPRLGEIIHFDPESFTIQRGEDLVVVNPQDYFQRVAGVEGDVIEVRDGRLWRNGAPMPDHLLPMGADQLPALRYEVPKGRVFAPVLHIPEDRVASMLGAGRTPTLASGVLGGYVESTMVPRKSVFGRAVGVVNPPAHRKGLAP